MAESLYSSVSRGAGSATQGDAGLGVPAPKAPLDGEECRALPRPAGLHRLLRAGRVCEGVQRRLRQAARMVDDQRFLVAHDIDEEAPWAGERATDQAQVARISLVLGYPVAATSTASSSDRCVDSKERSVLMKRYRSVALHLDRNVEIVSLGYFENTRCDGRAPDGVNGKSIPSEADPCARTVLGDVERQVRSQGKSRPSQCRHGRQHA